MDILIDTNVLISFDRDMSDDFIELLYQKYQEGAKLYTSVLVEYEYLYGLKKTLKNALDIAKLHFKELDILPISRELIPIAVKLEQSYSMGVFDNLIAATCIHYRLQLATLNKKHFNMIKKLKLWVPA